MQNLTHMTSYSPVEEKNIPFEQVSWLKKPIIPQIPSISIETILIILIMLLAFFSRFYLLGERVMSHDETNHVWPSFDLYQGRGYRHDPITHGPMQFHLIALSFFMFGDSDFTARIPAALFSVGAVFFAWWGFRRYLGKTGGLVAAFLMLISPYMLFYGRYTRNEGFIELIGSLMLFSILSYLKTGKPRYVYLLTLSTVLHFITKETSFIYTAQALIFLALVFISRVYQKPWADPAKKRSSLISLAGGVLLVILGLAASELLKVSTAAEGGGAVSLLQNPIPFILAGVGGVAILASLYFIVAGFTWASIRRERSFDMLILLGTLVLPQLSAMPVKLVGWDPLNYQLDGLLHTAVFLAPIFAISIAIGMWWKPRLWLANAAMFYAIFIVFYTTFFTNGAGFFTGIVGSLGYWLAQQGVQRGSQPWYYFALIQIPIYEFLPVIGALAAIYIGIKHPEHGNIPEDPDVSLAPGNGTADHQVEAEPPASAALDGVAEPGSTLPGDGLSGTADAAPPQAATPEFRTPVLALFAFWSLTSLIAYTVAGEKMPWLTVHIALPLIFTAAWGFGYLIDTTPWRQIFQKKGLIVVLLLPVFFFSLSAVVGAFAGTTPPFQGKDLAQLQATATFIISAVVLAGSAIGLYYLMDSWSGREIGRGFSMVFLAILAVLTIRTAWRASFINYDTAKEYLVYAHAARGPKDVLAQVEDISRRITGGLDIAVAYDDEDIYPFTWYLRNYPNKVFYANNPTNDLRNDPIIIVGDKNYDKIAPIVGQGYEMFQTMRLWWPNQDYFNLTWDRILYAITNPQMRTALWNIWFNRDYTLYAQITENSNLTLTTWQPSNSLRVYIRKDIVSKIWQYGAAPSSQPADIDPYQKNMLSLTPDRTLGTAGNGSGQFQSPRGMVLAADGSIYVADSQNNRIQHLSPDGTVLQSWGSFADAAKGSAPGGTFYEPWGVAVGPDGSVFVADTWNNRIQKFSANGQFETMWGYFGRGEQPEAFWGPRAVAVNTQGQVLVADTGNKRVVVFDSQGTYVTQFGTAGTGEGQLDEPVGLGLDEQGRVYVADTWNQRVDVFTPAVDGKSYTAEGSWPVAAWYGQGIENKPYLALSPSGQVVVSDPEAHRVLIFDQAGAFQRGWTADWGVVSGVAVDAQGGVWVVDSTNNRLTHFTLP